MTQDTHVPSSASAASDSFFRAIWRRKGIVLFLGILGVLGGYWYFTTLPDTFMSSSLIQVTMRRPANLPLDRLDTAIDFAPSAKFIRAEMTSQRVVDSAIELGRLMSVAGDGKSDADLRAMILGGLQVVPMTDNRDSGSRIMLSIDHRSGDPNFCAAAANALVDAYSKFLSESRTAATKEVIAYVRELQEQLVPQLERLETEYQAFRANSELEWTSAGEIINPFRVEAERLEKRRFELENEMISVRSQKNSIDETLKSTSNAQLALEMISTMLTPTSITAGGLKFADSSAVDPVLEAEQAVVSMLIEYEVLASSVGENHPARVALKNKIESTRENLHNLELQRLAKADANNNNEVREERAKALIKVYVTSLRQRDEVLNQQLAQIRLEEATAREKARLLSDKESEGVAYMRRISRLQEIVDSIDAKLEATNLPAQLNGPEVQVMQKAVFGSQTGPSLPTNLAYGGVLGLFLGSLIGWLVDWSERTYRSPDELVGHLKVPLLTHISLLSPSEQRKRKIKKGEADSLERVDPRLVVAHHPSSTPAESLRSIRNALLGGKGEGPRYRVVMVTGPLPGEGKSFVAANLAASLASMNKRVLLVDGDLRRPTLHETFGLVPNDLGITTVVNGDCTLQQAVVHTAVAGLDLLPCGPIATNPAELVLMPEFDQMLDEMRSHYDFVIIDSAPILAVTDSASMASLVDGVVLVSRIRRNLKSTAIRSVNLLRTLHVNVIGIVVNAIGDSSYSARYGTAWSETYGGRAYNDYAYDYRYTYGRRETPNLVTVRGASVASLNGTGADAHPIEEEGSIRK